MRTRFDVYDVEIGQIKESVTNQREAIDAADKEVNKTRQQRDKAKKELGTLEDKIRDFMNQRVTSLIYLLQSDTSEQTDGKLKGDKMDALAWTI